MDPKKKSRKRFYLLLTILLITSLFFLLRSKGEILGINLTGSWSFEFKERFLDDFNLEGKIAAELKNTQGEFAVVVESFDSSTSGKPSKQVHINEKESYPAASLYKLFLMAAVLKEVEEERLKMDQTISAPKEHLDKVLGGSQFGFKDVKGDVSFSVDEALKRIGRISDNYAAIMLAEKIGWSKIESQAKAVGATSTVMKSPISTTPNDISLFFRNLYQGKVVSPAASAKVVDFLSASQLNNRIPKQLPARPAGGPESLKIAHKTGELPRVRHDAGIVYLEDGRAYIIVLMSKNLADENEGVDVLARVSKVVYDYLVSPSP